MRRVKAFTLIELLMVIAILALLVSILMPTLVRAKALARDAACRMQLRGFGAAIAVFTADHNDYFLGVCGADTAKTGADQPWKRCWLGNDTGNKTFAGEQSFVNSAPQNGQLFPYTGGIKMYRCPGLPAAGWDAWNDPTKPCTGSNGRYDYTIFPLLSGAKIDRIPTQFRWGGGYYWIYLRMPLLLESHYANACRYVGGGWPYGGLNDWNEPQYEPRNGAFITQRSTGIWHPTGMANAAYIDGSAGPCIFGGAVGGDMWAADMPPDIHYNGFMSDTTKGWGALNRTTGWQ